MESVFYAKRCKDTTFFDRLATKKTKTNSRSILVRMFKNSLDAIIINILAHKNRSNKDDSENNFVYNFANQQQSC